MATTRSTRRASYADVGRKIATSDVSAQSASQPTGYRERAEEIGKTVSEAMAKLSEIDWKRESPAISEAESQMNETMSLYAENQASKADVKASYQQWVKAHRGGLF